MQRPPINADLVLLDVDFGLGRADVISGLVRQIAKAGRADFVGLEFDVLEREVRNSTGIGRGIAIPHGRSTSVSALTVAFARLKRPVDFGAFDGPADMVFLIAAPLEHDTSLLAGLGRSFVQADFVRGLRSARTPTEVVTLISVAMNADSPREGRPTEEKGPQGARYRTILVAVTGCTTGIAHNFMAADALKDAAKSEGVELLVEAQGYSDTIRLDSAVIASANAAIFATDTFVEGRERFAHLPVVECGVKRALENPAALIQEAVEISRNPTTRHVPTGAQSDWTGAGRSATKVGRKSDERAWGDHIASFILAVAAAVVAAVILMWMGIGS